MRKELGGAKSDKEGGVRRRNQGGVRRIKERKGESFLPARKGLVN